MNRKPPQFFLSILTAVVTGVGIAFIGIIGVRLAKSPNTFSYSMSIVTGISDSLTSGVGFVMGGVTSLRQNIHLPSLSTLSVMYEAQAEEDMGSDLTFTGEVLSAITPDTLSDSAEPITALAYSVWSLDKENILLEKDAERILPIASITKLITAVVARKLMDEDEIITITQKALNTEGSSGKFKLNDRFRLKEIMYPLLMVSSNDAAEAIARAYDADHGAGSFVKAMNAWVYDIGAYRTYFKDASGLSPYNVSTAHDISLISKWVKKNDPEILEITLTKMKTIRSITWINPTHFLSLSSYAGGKNGFIPEARQTNISLFELGSPKRLYAVVLLGSQARDKDTLSVLNKAVK